MVFIQVFMEVFFQFGFVRTSIRLSTYVVFCFLCVFFYVNEIMPNSLILQTQATRVKYVGRWAVTFGCGGVRGVPSGGLASRARHVCSLHYVRVSVR